MTSHYRLRFKIAGRLFVIAAVISAALASPAISQAALLPVGGQITPTSEAIPAGMTELATNTAPYAGIGFLGTLTSKVFTNDSSNPFVAATRLTFTYQIANAPESVHVLHRMSASNYTGFQTDVSFGPTPGVPPSQADRSTSDVVGFNFIETAGGVRRIDYSRKLKPAACGSNRCDSICAFVRVANQWRRVHSRELRASPGAGHLDSRFDRTSRPVRARSPSSQVTQSDSSAPFFHWVIVRALG